MGRRAMVIALFLELYLLFCCTAFADGVTRALLVGCDDFLTMEDTSPAAANNVTQMRQVLTGGSLDIQSLVTRRKGLSGIAELQELMDMTYEGADQSDVSYFYLSTHGIWTSEQANADVTFLLSDGKKEEGITARELRRMLDKIPGRKVVMLDACHAGAAIGKGTGASFANVFTGKDYVVICSSGAMEQSWYWSSGEVDERRRPGSGYFSGAAAMGLSVLGGFAADSNRDGVITLTQLKRYLRATDGASTVQTYPEEGDYPMMTYDVQAFDGRSRNADIEHLVFQDGALTDDMPSVDFSFTVVKQTKLAYLLVSRADGCWDFAGATLLKDDGDQDGVLSPGYHERSLSLQQIVGGDGGYVLLALIAWQQGSPKLSGSRVICLAPSEGDFRMEVQTEKSFLPDTGDELGITVFHTDPCELTVTVQDLEGHTVRRLAVSQASRPEGLVPSGSTFCWNGTLVDGSDAPQGSYIVKALARVGDQQYVIMSESFRLIHTKEIEPRTSGK